MPRRSSAFFRFAGAGLTLCALLGAPAFADDAGSTGSSPAASQIFDRAIAFVRAQTYPPYLSFIVTVRASAKSKWLVEQFQSVCRTRDDRVLTFSTPISSTNVPDNPYKFTLKVKGMAIHDSRNIDEPFGLPELSPIFTFGLLQMHPASSSARQYDVTLVGIETLNGHRVYHLSLVPLAQPKTYRLRDLWVDVRTSTIWKLTSAGAFASGPATGVPWTVTFTMDRGHWLIESEETTTPLLLGGYAPALDPYVPLPGATRYDGISYTFLNFEFPKTVGDYVFLESKPSQAVQM
jgi:hypothetical protein